MSVEKTVDVDMTQANEEGGLIVNTAVLSPSVSYNGSQLSMKFRRGLEEFNNTYTVPDVNININRNELTVVRYEWNEDDSDFKVYMLVNDNWELISKMEID